MEIIERLAPDITDKDVLDFQDNTGLLLPKSYINFLAIHNGGRPSPDCIYCDQIPGGSTTVQQFFGLGADMDASDLRWYIDILKSRIPIGFLPIACDSGGWIFCLSLLNDDHFGEVYLVDTFMKCEVYRIADDFETFLQMLTEFRDDLSNFT